MTPELVINTCALLLIIIWGETGARTTPARGPHSPEAAYDTSLPPITRNLPRVPNLRYNCTVQAGYSHRKPCRSGNPGQETGFLENSREKGQKQAGPEGHGPGNRSPRRARMGYFTRKRGMRPIRIKKREPGVGGVEVMQRNPGIKIFINSSSPTVT